MRARHHFGSELLIGLIVLGVGCGGTLHTGTARKPINNKPAPDGSCPSEDSACGIGIFAVCVDLQNDPDHCGACDRVCSPGIACQAGVCQQTACTGATIPFSGQTSGTCLSSSSWTSTATATWTSWIGTSPCGAAGTRIRQCFTSRWASPGVASRPPTRTTRA